MPKEKGKTKYDLLALAEYEKISNISYVTVSDGTKLRILQSSATTKKKEVFTFVLVGAWGSMVLGWDNLLMEAMKHFDILYIETREKGSSQITKDFAFDMNRFTLDIKEIIEKLNYSQEEMILLTSSFSSMLASYMLKNNMINPHLTIFVGPVERVPLPKTIKFLLAILPKWLYSLIKPIGIWWVKNVIAEDEEHGAKYTRTVREGDPVKWKRATKHFANKLFWDIYEGYDNRVLVVDESEDKLHDTNNTREIAKLIKNHDYIDLKTNKKTHSSDLLKTIFEYL